MRNIIVLSFLVVSFVLSAPLANAQYGGGGGAVPLFFLASPKTKPAPAPVVVKQPSPQGQVLGAETFVFSKNLGFGSRGVDVTELQKRLATEGFFKVTPTGYFGSITKASVVAYQKAHKISPTSGFVGPLTRAELNK